MTSMLADRPTVIEHVLHCPKCHGDMVTFERSGVTLDQCRECRGVYLDRGELERLVEAEAIRNTPRSWHGDRRAPTPEPRGYRSAWDHDDDDDDWRGERDRWDDRRSERGHRPQKRRSLLGELLEGFGD